MIYYFHGPNSFASRQAFLQWKRAFITKFGIHNCIEIQAEELKNLHTLKNIFQNIGLFQEKRLILLETAYLTKDAGIIEYLESVFQGEIHDYICIYAEKSPGVKIENIIKKYATLKKYEIKNPGELSKHCQTLFPDISKKSIDTIISLKSNDEAESINELNKLSLLDSDIQKTLSLEKEITPQGSEHIFTFIDILSNGNIEKFLQKMQKFLQYESSYSLLALLIAHLKIIIYISILRDIQKLQSDDIRNKLSLGNRSFLVNKTYAMKAKTMRNLYRKLIKIDQDIKQGKLQRSDNVGIQNHITDIIIKECF